MDSLEIVQLEVQEPAEAMVLTSNFSCIKACGKAFGSRRGLTKHQDRCGVYNETISADLLEAMEKEESASKRQRSCYHDADRDHPGIFSNVFNTSGMDTDVTHDIDQIDRTPRDAPCEKTSPDIQVIEVPMEELGRGKRRKWKTKRYIDPRPEPPAPLPEPEDTAPNAQSLVTDSDVSQTCTTLQNANGVYREYVSRPTYIPDESSFEEEPTFEPPKSAYEHEGQTDEFGTFARNIGTIESSGFSSSHISEGHLHWFAPFLNVSSFRLLNWFWRSPPTKSISDLQNLADQVLKADDFRKEDLQAFNARRENKRLDEWTDTLNASTPFHARDGWTQASVEIMLPTRIRTLSPSEIPRFTVSGLHYRHILEVIKKFWQRSPEQAPERVYDEMYSGDAWLKAHNEVQKLPRTTGDTNERVIAALMFWQDSTHLTNFGTASLWPLYLYYGNQSKYERSKPSCHASHHIAYLPKLPDSISDAIKNVNGGKLPTKETLTHCKRDLMHALLMKIFDDEFIQAYREGLVIQCFDGVVRRIFPRILTFSADYPEKALLASIKFLSTYPCPRCLIRKSDVHHLGSRHNESIVKQQSREDSHPLQMDIATARNFIYKDGRGVKSIAVEALLASKSLVPTSNAFSRVMLQLGFNYYRIFVVDFLHEIELGLWKMILIHLIRILTACGPEVVLLLNERYRLISSFGYDTIRKFTNDVSSLKKLAARDYEDLLLCSMPAFEGLFPEPHDGIVQRLLFTLLNWHALAKLRTHTDTTLQLLDIAKRNVSAALQTFQDVTCQAYETRELPSERSRREKRKAKDLARRTANLPVGGLLPQESTGNSGTHANQTLHGTALGINSKVKEARGSKRKVLNLKTYKVHAPEHYTNDIRDYGTVDSFSTQIGELEHRRVKRFYSRTNKHNSTEQITRIDRREHALREIAEKEPIKASANTVTENHLMRSVPRDQEAHHFIPTSRNDSIYLPAWLRDNIYDPATKSFQKKLKDHLLERLLRIGYDKDASADFTDADRNTISIEYNRLYIHKVFRVNYTTYDGRRQQDTMNPRTRADVMALNQQDRDDATDCGEGHQLYLYARVIGVFHAMVKHTGRKSTTEGSPVKMEILWVRWFSHATVPSLTGLPSTSLDALTFVSETESCAEAFGFLDPSQVVRSVHLIPAFRHGKTRSLLSSSIGRKSSDSDEDWRFYYINKFVDRDTYMRYHGGGIGHTLLQLKSSTIDAPGFESITLEGDQADQSLSVSNVAAYSTDSSRRRVVFDTHSDEVMSIDEDKEEEESDFATTSDEEEEK